jgi:hypothetical protein
VGPPHLNVVRSRWTTLLDRVRKDPKLALIVGTTEYDTGRIYQVTAYGNAEIMPMDLSRARRMLERYMGPDQSTWSTAPTDYRGYLRDGGPPGAVWLKITPKKFVAYNFSYSHSPYAPR